METVIALVVLVLVIISCLVFGPRWFAFHIAEEKAWREKEAREQALRDSYRHRSSVSNC